VQSGLYYLTMEWVDGRSLADVLDREKRLPIAVVETIGSQLLRALAAAHEEGVLHRDIKPANLLLDRSGRLKVTDFGIARLMDKTESGSRKLTATGMIVGTADYMAPEQFGEGPVDARADLYSAGAVLYECLTGVSPHAGLSIHELIVRSMQNAQPPDPTGQRPDTPGRLVVVVRRALATAPADRWQSARDMLAALEGSS
jgi:serine/threonine protein kinase